VPPTFADIGVPAPLVATLARHDITVPFPIQAATLPDALAGRDVCGKAPTGSGKTIAFGLALLARVDRARPGRPTGLVLVPTRELAAQVRDELDLLAGPKGRRVEAFYGGTGFGRQLAALRRGVDIAVACPGRLADLVGRGDIRLDAVAVVVVDEADRMADMGFLPEVRRLLDRTPATRQTLLFSATLDGDVDALISRFQREPRRHHVAVDPADGARVQHHFWAVAREARARLCAQLVATAGPTIVFCRTKRGADRVARQLAQAGVRAGVIHGDRSQAQRERTLHAFHGGKVDALVATDVAARGIHVDDVSRVIHFDPPADEKDYVHRSGRTGRAGAAGVVVTFVAPDQRKEVARMQRVLGFPTELETPAPAALPATSRLRHAPKPPRRRPRPAHAAPRTPPRGGNSRRRPGRARRVNGRRASRPA
jgi:superfamily II DNA/RNA helicase